MTLRIRMTPAAIANAEETGADIHAHWMLLRGGLVSPEGLLAHCLDGADPDREEGWRDYVSAIAAAAGL